MIEPIQMGSIFTIGEAGGAKSAAKTDGLSFGDIFNGLVDMVNSTEAADQVNNVSMLTGDADDLHTSMISAQKAELAVSLTVQIRDRVVDAYNEIMRMQV